MSLAVLPLHLGALHPYEQALTLLLAFGPFVVLGVVLRRRNADLAAEERAQADVAPAAVAEADSSARESASRTAPSAE